jgi:putative PIN family toxin of toxin-antitoxin system
MKVFLDTHVLASAFATRGICSDVLREVFTSHDLYTSIEVLEELRGVLKDKFGFPENLLKKILSLVQREANKASSQDQVEITIKDKDDIPIISAAMAAGTHVFVTGDKELQDIAKIGELGLVSPRKFWELIKTQ